MPGKISLLPLLLLLTACRSNEKQQTPPLKNYSDKENVELEVKSVQKSKWKGRNAVICKLALTNNTFHNINYLNLTCSYDDAYCSDFSKLYHHVAGCNSNVPHIYTLGFYDSNIRTVSFLLAAHDTLSSHLPVRFGFHFVKTSTIPHTNLLQLLSDTSNIIWSKPVELQNSGPA